MAAERKKINPADEFFIKHHLDVLTKEEMSEKIGLCYDSVAKYHAIALVEQRTELRKSNNNSTVLTTAMSQRGDDAAVKVKNPQQSPLERSIWRG